MYGWIFRHLPGPLWLRIFTSLVLIAGALVLMVQFLFPWMSDLTQVEAGRVTDQSEAANAAVDQGKTVNVVVAKAPPPPPSPTATPTPTRTSDRDRD